MTQPSIVFDLGGVLVDWNPRHLYRKIFDDPEKMEWFLSNVCTSDWNGRLDTGISFEENSRPLIAQFPEYRSEILAWLDRWEEMFAGPISGTLQIFDELRSEGHKTYALTNWSHETWPRGLKLFPFFRKFDGHVVSGDLGFKKPDRRIFEHLFKTFSLNPAESIFIDDLRPNVEAAQELGMNAICFEGAEKLRKDLRHLL